MTIYQSAIFGFAISILRCHWSSFVYLIVCLPYYITVQGEIIFQLPCKTREGRVDWNGREQHMRLHLACFTSRQHVPFFFVCHCCVGSQTPALGRPCWKDRSLLVRVDFVFFCPAFRLTSAFSHLFLLLVPSVLCNSIIKMTIQSYRSKWCLPRYEMLILT